MGASGVCSTAVLDQAKVHGVSAHLLEFESRIGLRVKIEQLSKEQELETEG